MPSVLASHVPEAIRRIADAGDRQLAWQFFVFFARFEYALKRHTEYLMPGTGDAQPNWDRFASDHAASFEQNATQELAGAVAYFKGSPPRKQIRANGQLTWSEPIRYDGKEPLLIWLLRDVRVVRDNLFHGGKFPLFPVSDPSRDRELISHALVILDTCLELNREVREKFYEGINE